jgi:hypothetical protein
MPGVGKCNNLNAEPGEFLNYIRQWVYQRPRHISGIVLIDSLNSLINHPGYRRDQEKEELATAVDRGGAEGENVVNKTLLGHSSGFNRLGNQSPRDRNVQRKHQLLSNLSILFSSTLFIIVHGMWRNEEPGPEAHKLSCKTARRYYNALMIYTWMPARRMKRQWDRSRRREETVCAPAKHAPFTHANCGADDWLLALINKTLKEDLRGTGVTVQTITRDADLERCTEQDRLPDLQIPFRAIMGVDRGDHLANTQFDPLQWREAGKMCAS